MANQSLTRDSAAVLSKLKETATGQLVALAPCFIQVPSRFLERDLADIGSDTYVYGIHALVCGDKYTVGNVTAMLDIQPAKILTSKIKGKDYHEFHFDAGQIMIRDLNVVKRELLIFNVLDELIIKGNVPWYMNYNDLGQIFDKAKDYAASSVGDMPEVIELIVSIIARIKSDRSLYYRTMLEDLESIKTNKPEYVPLASVYYTSTNTLNKLAGNYFNEGVVSALINPTTEVERIESLLRM